jgi:diaminopimelate epimerase
MSMETSPPPQTSLRFDKYEGLGNDFIVMDATSDQELTTDFASKLCDRRFGVGADGVLLVLPPRTPGHAARMRVINADGSVPEMCGNGLRCVALHMARREPRLYEANYDTDAGSRVCRVELASDIHSASITVDMGIARVVEERTIELSGEVGAYASIPLVVVDTGNPHAVFFEKVVRADIDRIGPRLATHGSFPAGVNVGFASARSAREIDLTVWERGVGLTLACGTGACAMVAAACKKGISTYGDWVTVHLPGGDLVISVERGSGRVTMRGPARHVFSGQFALT